MKNEQTSLEDIKAIRQMMEESSKFLSLSGLSGVAAGLFALLGAAVAHFIILDQGGNLYNEFMVSLKGANTSFVRIGLFSDALAVLVLAVSSAWYLSWRHARKNGNRFWTHTARKMAWNMFFVLAVGGLFSFILAWQENIRLVASTMLIFYGMALLMTSRYTQRDIKYLGYTEIGLGLLAGIFLNYGLLFWSLGFGVFHIVYGVAMYFKYER